MNNENTLRTDCDPAVGSSDLVRPVEPDQFQSERPCLPLDIARCAVFHKMHRSAFLEWMQSLEAYPHLLFQTERTLSDVGRCQDTLCRWKELGHPDLGDWPVDNARFLEGSCWDVLLIVDDRLTGARRPNDSGQARRARSLRDGTEAPSRRCLHRTG